MEWTRRQGWIAALLVILAASALLLVGLSSFGIWDPWELSAADLARQVATGTAGGLDHPPLSTWLVARGFALFGVHEWSGRLPIALAGIVTLALTYVLVARFAGRRAGVWAALIAATSPLFLFNARQMLGVAPAFAASAAVFLCALAAVFQPAGLRARSDRRRLASVGWLVGLGVSAALATLASGVLLGVAPPLLGVAVAVVSRNELTRPFVDRRRAGAALVVVAAALIVSAGAAHAIWADYAGFGWWTGGVPRGGDPPTWEVAVERLFHSFAPWSAVLPLALARMLLGPPALMGRARRSRREASPGAPYRTPATPARAPLPIVPTIGGKRAAVTLAHPDERALRLALIAWVAFGYLAQTLFTARYGAATFIPIVGAAAAVGLLIRDVERTRRAWWGTAVVVFLFTMLILRDFGEYPSGPIEGLAADGIEVPEVFRPTAAWAALLLLFATLAALGLAADPSGEAYPLLRDDLRAIAGAWRDRTFGKLAYVWLRLGVPVETIAQQWKRGPGFRVWLVLLGLVPLGMMLFGLACLVAPDALTSQLGMTSLGLRIGMVLLAVPAGVALGIGATRLALLAFAKLGTYRFVPALVAALVFGGYASLRYLPELSSHFSPREVYDSYNELAGRDEPLGEYRVGGRAAAYYATGDVEELDTQAALIDFLHQERRVWAAFRADDLAAIDREYRRREGRHLFVADARSARMILATNRPIGGMHNQNYLADAVLDEPPRPQHPVSVNFDNRIELLGIDLDLPHGSYVGPGEAFRITWYFRVNAPVPGSYQPFVHIDGPGERINGDHEPVEGRYPVRLWEPGDIIVDRQELRVPANYRRGDLVIYMGFYAGEQRLEIVSGPADDVNRARAGTLSVR